MRAPEQNPPVAPPQAKPAANAAIHIKIGEELYKRKAYDAALKSFTTALEMEPENKEALLQAGWAAYWSQNPRLALAHWNALLNDAPRNSDEEWELECCRVMGLVRAGPGGRRRSGGAPVRNAARKQVGHGPGGEKFSARTSLRRPLPR